MSSCSYCGRGSTSGPMVCSRCKYANYCSRVCQKTHWSYHKTVCIPHDSEKSPLKSETHRLSIESFIQIKVDTVCEYIRSCDLTLPMVSVGCGNGVLEYVLKQRTPEIPEWALVDPKPQEYERYPSGKSIDKSTGCELDAFLKPDWPLVKTMIQDRKDLVNNCNILLCWPNPNHSFYDVESIILLKPKFIVLIYEIKGAAGGHNLLYWLEKIGFACPWGTSLDDPNLVPPLNYRVTKSHKVDLHNLWACVNAILLIERVD